MRTERQDASIRATVLERGNIRTALDLLLVRAQWVAALRIVASVPVDTPVERLRLIDELVNRVGDNEPEVVPGPPCRCAQPPTLQPFAWGTSSVLIQRHENARAETFHVHGKFIGTVTDGTIQWRLLASFRVRGTFADGPSSAVEEIRLVG